MGVTALWKAVAPNLHVGLGKIQGLEDSGPRRRVSAVPRWSWLSGTSTVKRGDLSDFRNRVNNGEGLLREHAESDPTRESRPIDKKKMQHGGREREREREREGREGR